MAAKSAANSLSQRLGAYADEDSGELNVIIETPKGSRNKFSYDEETGLFKLGGVLPSGAVFPFDFGFVPQTLGGDGDPLDVLLLMDEPAFAGCLVASRLIGVIAALQTERDGETTRNDRLIAVASNSHGQGHVQSLSDLNPNLVEEIEHFFVSYNAIKGKKFESLGRYGPDVAQELVRQGIMSRNPKRRMGRAKKLTAKKRARK